YLTTVYQIELLRMKNLALDYLCAYLVDDRLQGPEIYPFVEDIADSILSQAITDSAYKRHNSLVVENHLRTLLVFAGHRIPMIRKFVMRWILRILNVVPHMLFHRPAISYMLDICRYLDNEKVGHKEEHLRFSEQLSFINYLEAHESAVDFYALCQDWISAALAISPSETIPILQHYISDISSISPWIGSRQVALGAPTEDISSSFLLSLFQKFYGDSTTSANMIRHSSRRIRTLGEVQGLLDAQKLFLGANGNEPRLYETLSKDFAKGLRKLYRDSASPHFSGQLYDAISKCAALTILNDDKVESELIMLICFAPQVQFSAIVVEIVLEALAWVMSTKPSLTNRVLAQLFQSWEAVALQGLGIYSSHKATDPFAGEMTYGAPRTTKDNFTCEPHAIWINFFNERFNYDRLQGLDCVMLYGGFIRMATNRVFEMSTNFKAHEPRLDIASLAIKVAKELGRRNNKTALFVWTDAFRYMSDLFNHGPVFGEMTRMHFSKMVQLYHTIKSLKFDRLKTYLTTTLLRVAFIVTNNGERVEFSDVQQLLVILFEYDLNRFAVWLSPLAPGVDGENQDIPPPVNERAVKWPLMVKIAWRVNPLVAIQLRSRFVTSLDSIDNEIAELAKYSHIKVISYPSALSVFLKNSWKARSDNQLRHLLYWSPVTPIIAIQILSQSQKLQPWVIQFAIRSLEDFSITQVFFYIPQLVQALRYDTLGYIERYILEAAKSSQYFAHQIIWNMEANMYKDDAKEVPDALKPAFDRIISKVISSLTGGDKDFFEREFAFFKEVTDISGKLKPLVKIGASKQEKKKKIDEEIRKIKVDVGVYLPTNPERTVVDIDYDSGRPLQSHAKAPFMATFKVQNTTDEQSAPEWMSSMFKVGDDCRQDVLALQLISVFQAIFHSAGLNLYTFPYRVVATAPGCGVIEVIPNSMSRDMMGREKVNSLYDWFLAQFGPENSVRYKTARIEFVKSLAAYSIIMFMLQIKDRHNGNIMFDKEGHLIHIDFGFMLSIAPGGGILEVSPFKLTNEMIQVMGGDASSPAYQLFSEWCVKGYLACRLHAEEVISVVQLMLDSGLPCFKGDVTIRKLKERFQLDKSERGAADFMIDCIRQSHENTRAGLYDTFQFLQNGIPYAR
ncbi:phosphatidylinositol-4- kinase, partial [Kappamyces sp. JEL0680]